MEEEKQLTAVEWLEIRYIANGSYLTRSDIFFAKELEKEQMIDAYNKGEFNQGCNGDAEQYYNETFKSE